MKTRFNSCTSDADPCIPDPLIPDLFLHDSCTPG